MKAGLCALIVLAGAALDLTAKACARANLEPYGPPIDFLPFISLRLTFNEGVSFGLLSFGQNDGKIALLALTGLLTLAFAVWAYRMPYSRERAALSVVVAGAVANVIDRAMNGAVTDYLDLHFWGWNPFVFNLADVWITIGVILLLISSIFDNKNEIGR